MPDPVALPPDIERTMILWESQSDPRLECRRVLRHECWLVLGPLYSMVSTDRFEVVRTIADAARLTDHGCDPRPGYRFFSALTEQATSADSARVYAKCADAFFRWAEVLKFPIEDVEAAGLPAYDDVEHFGSDQ